MPELRILILTEDGAGSAHDVVVSLSKSMLKIVDPSVQTQRERIQFDEERGEGRRAMRANRWRSTAEEDEPFIRALQRAIVRALLVVDDTGEPNGYVFFHYDGDTRYGEREGCRSLLQFEEFKSSIRRYLQDSGADVERTMNRFIEIVPYYCIEAWTYQHTSVARRICASRCGRHIEVIDRVAADRGALDEIERPWAPEQFDTCLGKSCNRELVGPGYPAEEVFLAEKSFHDTVNHMHACRDLVRALVRTYAPPAATTP